VNRLIEQHQHGFWTTKVGAFFLTSNCQWCPFKQDRANCTPKWNSKAEYALTFALLKGFSCIPLPPACVLHQVVKSLQLTAFFLQKRSKSKGVYVHDGLPCLCGASRLSTLHVPGPKLPPTRLPTITILATLPVAAPLLAVTPTPSVRAICLTLPLALPLLLMQILMMHTFSSLALRSTPCSAPRMHAKASPHAWSGTCVLTHSSPASLPQHPQTSVSGLSRICMTTVKT
jgi:hypothetical protein